MRRTIVSFSLLGLVACSTSSPTNPSQTTGPYAVTGSVRDQAGQVVANATVAVADQAPNPNAGRRTRTDGSGRYTLDGLQQASFSLGATAPGHFGSPLGVTLTGATPAATVDFALATSPGGIAFSDISINEWPFTTYTESGFTVQPSSGAWLGFTNYGNPTPYAGFKAPAGTTTSGELKIRAGGAGFRFVSVDLYSSTTPIPYVFTGLSGSTTVFTVEGTRPNTFGEFKTVDNPHSADTIDALLIRLSNPAAPCCANPVGLDNIRLQR